MLLQQIIFLLQLQLPLPMPLHHPRMGLEFWIGNYLLMDGLLELFLIHRFEFLYEFLDAVGVGIALLVQVWQQLLLHLEATDILQLDFCDIFLFLHLNLVLIEILLVE